MMLRDKRVRERRTAKKDQAGECLPGPSERTPTREPFGSLPSSIADDAERTIIEINLSVRSTNKQAIACARNLE